MLRSAGQLAIVVAVFIASECAAFAQTEGRISVGASVTVNNTTDADVASTVAVGPLVRLNPRKGWGLAGGFNWFRADLREPGGAEGDFARLRVRPLMAGVSYTVGSGAMLASFSIVGGPSFNKAEFQRAYIPGSSESIDANNSFAVRPGVAVTWTLAPRWALVGFGGYFINRPEVVYHDRAGQEFRDRWKADSLVVSAGVVYSLF
jgi:hypothetical protein